MLTLVLSIPLLTNFFGSALNFVAETTTYSTYAIYGSVALCFALKYRLNGKQFYFFVMLTSVVLGLFLINRIVFPESFPYLYMNRPVLMRELIFYYPSAYAMAAVDDWSHFFRYMRFTAFWTPFLCWIALTYFKLLDIINYMHLSNALLPGFLVSWYIVRIYNEKKYYIPAIFSLYLQLMYGGRMSFASGLIFVVLVEIIFVQENEAALKVIKVSFLSLCVILGIVYYKNVLEIFVYFLESMNVESRTIRNIVNGTIFESKTRDAIYKNAWYEMKNMGTGMYGLFGDRLALEKYYPMHGYTSNYVHNFFYEMILSFGWILGSFLSVGIVLKIIKGLLFKGNFEKRIMVAYFVCLIFMRLLVSSSFLIEGQFLFLLGILFNKTESVENDVKEKSVQNNIP